MAKIQRFNPPPGWPPAPQGWTPPPSWAPDPSWGPVPPGWPLWVSERANPRALGLAVLSAAGWFVVLVLVGVLVSGGRFSWEAVGEILGREFLAGAVTALIAWVSRSRWPVWLYPIVVFGLTVVFSAVSAVGRMNGA